METRSSSKRKNTNEVFLSSTKQRNVQHFTIYDDEDFYEELPKTLKKSNILKTSKNFGKLRKC